MAPRNSLFAEATEKRSLVEIAVKKDLSSLDSDGTSRKLGAALPTERFTLGFGITVALLEVRFIMKSCGHVNTKAIFIQHHHCSLTPEFSDALFPPPTKAEEQLARLVRSSLYSLTGYSRTNTPNRAAPNNSDPAAISSARSNPAAGVAACFSR